MVAKSVIDTVQDYAQSVHAKFPLRKVFLFGSYAKGTQRLDSDIDVAIVMQNAPKDVLQTEAEMFRLGMDIDVRIEPIIIDEEHDPSGFYGSIEQYGKLIFSFP